MMLSDADRKKAADILMAAQKERKQAAQLHVTFPDITIEDSYAISTDVMQRKVRAGAKLIGHKVGLTSKAMVEHNLSVVADLSDHITVLTRGRVLAEGDYDTVSANADVREAYMAIVLLVRPAGLFGRRA